MLFAFRAALVGLALTMAMTAGPAAAQVQLYVSGKNQGPIEPAAASSASLERRMLMPIPIQAFSISVFQLYDPSNPGVPIGPRQVSPLALAKNVDATTLDFLTAMTDGEELETCFLEAYAPNGPGGSQLVLVLTLNDAYVVSSSLSSSGDGSPTSENLQIGFSTAEWFNPVTGETHTDTMSPSSVTPPQDPALALATAPNPTSGATEFSFRLPASGDVTIDVFDYRGRRVARVFDGEAAETGGTVAWNGRDASGQPVASGVYLVKMRAGNWLTTHKMSVLR